jgi:hypothetical protein
LGVEVAHILKSDPKNGLAFTDRDPLENPEISNPDDLRRLISVRRTVQFLDNTVGQRAIDMSVLARVVPVLRSHGLGMEMIARLVDSIHLTGSPEASGIYIPLILGEFALSESLRIDRISALLHALTIPAEEDIEKLLIECRGDGLAVPEPPSKRRASTRKR